MMIEKLTMKQSNLIEKAKRAIDAACLEATDIDQELMIMKKFEDYIEMIIDILKDEANMLADPPNIQP